MKELITLAAFSILLSSCFSVEFLTPQPQGDEDLNSFPDHLQGTYAVDGDTAFFVKPQSYIMAEEKHDEAIPLEKAETDSTLRFDGDFIYDSDIGADIPIKFSLKNDTVRYHYNSYKEYFLSDSVIIRKFRKYTVVNLKSGESWSVMLVEREKEGDLNLTMINKDDYEDGRECDKDSLIEEIEKVCKVERLGDNSFLLNPSKKEFKKLVKAGVFRPYMKLEKLE